MVEGGRLFTCQAGFSLLAEELPERRGYLRGAVSHGLSEAEFELGVAYSEGELLWTPILSPRWSG